MTSSATIQLLAGNTYRRQATEQRAAHRLTPQQKQYVLRAESNLFLSEQPNERLEPILENQGINYRKIGGGPDGISLRRIYLRRISIEDYSELFEIDDDLGEPAFVMIVRDVDALTAVDLVAWPIKRPDVYGTYFEYAGLLGADAVVDPASFDECPCPIWATPLAWLRADLRGCVVLNPCLAAPILAQAPGQFQCEDEEHARWLIDTGAVPISKLLVPARKASA
jgi:hypothetical protein